MGREEKKNKELLLKYHASKDKAIYDELFLNNIRLINYYISKYVVVANKSKEEILADYFSVGCIGLHKAIVDFDIKRIDQIAFSNVALTSIRNEVYKELKKLRKQQNYVKTHFKVDENRFDEEVEEKIYDEYKNKKIKDAINKLDSKSKEIVELAYGFNNKERMTSKEIAIKLGMSLIEVNKILLSVREVLKQELIEFNQAYSLQKKETRLDQLYSKYGREQVDIAIASLSEKAQLMLSLFHGVYKDHTMTIKELAEIFECSVSNVTSVIHDALNKVEDSILNPKKNRLAKLYHRYGKEKIDAEIANLREVSQKALKLYYGLDGEKKIPTKQIATIIGYNSINTIKLINRAINKLERVFENPKTNKLQLLYSEYGEEKVNGIIAKLSEKNKVILKAYYGIDAIKPLSIKEISAKYGYQRSDIASSVHNAIKNITRKLENKEKYLKQERLKMLYSKYGKARVEEVISSLDNKKQLILRAYYREDDKKVRMDDIAIDLGYSLAVVRGRIYRYINEVETQLIKEEVIKANKKI